MIEDLAMLSPLAWVVVGACAFVLAGLYAVVWAVREW